MAGAETIGSTSSNLEPHLSSRLDAYTSTTSVLHFDSSQDTTPKDLFNSGTQLCTHQMDRRLRKDPSKWVESKWVEHPSPSASHEPDVRERRGFRKRLVEGFRSIVGRESYEVIDGATRVRVPSPGPTSSRNEESDSDERAEGRTYARWVLPSSPRQTFEDSLSEPSSSIDENDETLGESGAPDEIPDGRVLELVQIYVTASTTLREVARTLGELSSATSIWRALSNRLLDLQDSLEAAAIAFTSWQNKLHIDEGRAKPRSYFQTLYGARGWTHIEGAINLVLSATRTVEKDTEAIVDKAFTAARSKVSTTNMGTLTQNLRRIQQNSTLTRRFYQTTSRYMDSLEEHIEDLHRNIGRLERLSQYHIETEHGTLLLPSTSTKLPGRFKRAQLAGPEKTDSRGTNPQWAELHREAQSTKVDAKDLFSARDEDTQTRIGFYTPDRRKESRRDFVVLVTSEDGLIHEIVVHPVTITVARRGILLHQTLSDAISATLRSPNQTTYLLPSQTSSEGFFLLSVSDRPIFVGLEKEDTALNSTIIPTKDQIGIACGIARGAFRLLSTPWLQLEYLHSQNFNWCRRGENAWAITLTTAYMSHVTRNIHNLQSLKLRIFTPSHKQIFSIGMILVDLTLKSPALVLDNDKSAGILRIYKYTIEPDAESNAAGIAADVEYETNNLLLGSMVFFCLSVLQNKELIAESEAGIQKRYYEEVVTVASQLEDLLAEDGLGAKEEDATGSISPSHRIDHAVR